ncbi:DNA-binding response OmpR family regulator [Sphingomonas kaistensis]|uniref:DNA-binding response OmpR family regulator n=1 Tax=Sphingomonas kaistensis TaxID=298708 RepID=A0A7X5Y6I2_9SPHN|nr:winged helix-turn-helix domain-containing protein [Sphingomonas kaistensis]NJC05974.1 DNA-binding response OmpR family regulator [Sphingomonas kaistensis]
MLVEGRRIELDSRSFAILQALAERFGQRVGKDALLAAAWPNQVVHENSLAKAISRLRRALDGSGVEIVASYGVGYLLRGVPEAEGDVAPDATPLPAESDWPAGRKWLLASLLVVLLALAGVVAIGIANRQVAFRETAPITHDAPDAQATILWVDDHPANNEREIEYLKQQKVAVHQATTTEDALNLLRINDYRLVVSDLGRGDDRLAGLKMTRAMSEQGMAAPVMIYTVRPSEPERQRAQKELVARSGAADLALTPAEVRAKVMARVLGRTADR